MRFSKIPSEFVNKPKYTFGTLVRFHDEFHGNMEGTIHEVMEITVGYLWWKKRSLIYGVTINKDDYEIAGYVSESKLTAVPPKLKPVR